MRVTPLIPLATPAVLTPLKTGNPGIVPPWLQHPVAMAVPQAPGNGGVVPPWMEVCNPITGPLPDPDTPHIM